MSSDSSKILYESEQLSHFSKTNLDYLQKLRTQFGFMINNASLYVSHTSRDLNSLTFPASNDVELTSHQVISSLHLQSKGSLNDLKAIIEAMQDELIIPLDEFYLRLSNIYMENLDEIHNISRRIFEGKQNLDKAQMKYIDISKQTSNIERKLSSHNDNNDPFPIEGIELDNLQDLLSKCRSQKENYGQLYKYEIIKVNQVYAVNNVKYNALANRLKASEESRTSFITLILGKYSNIIEQYTKARQALEEVTKSLVEKINIEKDIKSILDAFNNVNLFNERFPKEVFIEYDINSSNINDDDPIDHLLSSFSALVGAESKSSSLFSEFEIISESKVYSDNYQTEIITDFIGNLFKAEIISHEQMGKVTDCLNNNSFFAKTFLNQLLSKHHSNTNSKHTYHLLNYENLVHLANILNSIGLNFDYSQRELNEINYATIHIADKAFYSNGLISNDYTDIIYLCAILSKHNKLYQLKSFWKEIILAKLVLKLEDHLQQLLKIDIVKPKKEKKDFFDSISDLRSGIKNVFNKTGEAKSLLEMTGLSKRIQNYNSLPDYKRPYLDNFASKDLIVIIREFIPYFCQFNFAFEDASELLNELKGQYGLTKEQHAYFNISLVSYTYTIKGKRSIRRNERNAKLTMKLYDIKHKSKEQIVCKYSIPKGIEFMSMKHKIAMIMKITSFLPYETFANLLELNKAISIENKRMIIKGYLENNSDMPLDAHVKIWGLLLNIPGIRKKYDYVKESMIAENELDAKIVDVIHIDVLRTSFPSNSETSRVLLRKILITLANIKPSINYCQGMNYVASFVLQICNYKEEATFYFLLALFETAGYENIFTQELEKLKAGFFIFERLLSLYLPYLHSYFRQLSINVNFFCPQWFITLFTNSSTFITRENPPKVILRIWDEYILGGWKALMSAGLSILKYHEGKIMSMKYDGILNIMPHCITASDLLKNDHYDDFMRISSRFKLKRMQIENLENEYETEKTIIKAYDITDKKKSIPLDK